MPEHSQPLDLNQALERLVEVLPPPTETTTLPLMGALGYVLAKDVRAPVDLPPFRASAMDGFAVRRADLDVAMRDGLTLIGESLAGHPYDGTVEQGACVRVFTGGKLPDGADQVVLQEELAAPAEDGRVRFTEHRPSETFVRPVGHDVRAGDVLASAGTVISGFTVGTLAAAGVAEVTAFAPIRVGVFSSGDELVDPGVPPERLADGEIYDSNRVTVMALLRDAPCEVVDLGRLADDPKAVRRALADGADRCDVLITSGGVSVGDADFITRTIAELGTLDFWRLNLKPGKPMAFGRIGDCYLFGLPGNPVSTIVTLLLLALPAIDTLAGTSPSIPLRIPAVLGNDISHTPGRTEFQRGTLSQGARGLVVTHTGDQSSNRLSTFAAANCLIEVDKAVGNLEQGSVVDVILMESLVP